MTLSFATLARAPPYAVEQAALSLIIGSPWTVAVLSGRPSRAVGLALRADWPVSCEILSSDGGSAWTRATSDGRVKGITGETFSGFVKEGSVYFDGSAAQYATSGDAINWTLSSSPRTFAVGVA
jgi:hypothetical protein